MMVRDTRVTNYVCYTYIASGVSVTWITHYISRSFDGYGLWTIWGFWYIDVIIAWVYD
ncbi:hypothetical protein BD779DRAFT_275595 [Infundibulicybe gibba]|nr:hypothetical protein BD779DRAFT_275595 [Infundibulicybe gibba]